MKYATSFINHEPVFKKKSLFNTFFSRLKKALNRQKDIIISLTTSTKTTHF